MRPARPYIVEVRTLKPRPEVEPSSEPRTKRHKIRTDAYGQHC